MSALGCGHVTAGWCARCAPAGAPVQDMMTVLQAASQGHWPYAQPELARIATALEALVEAVGHRDVKPDNVLNPAVACALEAATARVEAQARDLRRVVQAGEQLAAFVARRIAAVATGPGHDVLAAWREVVGPGPRANVVGGPELVPPGGGV